jgi:hypothetical protein
MTASDETRGVALPGTARTGTPDAGNAGELLGTREIGGQLYARYRATPGTWVSASMRQQGYGLLYRQDRGYGAYEGLIRAPDGSQLANVDRVRPGQEYLVPVRRAPQRAPAPALAPAPEPARPVASSGTNAPFAVTEATRGTDNRYGGSQPPPPPAAGAAPLLYPAARPVGDALSRAALRWGGAEVVTGEAALSGAAGLTAPGWLTLGVGVVAIGLAAWGAYEAYGAYREYQSKERALAESRALLQSLERARAVTRALLRKNQQNAHQLWQNELITDDEYFLYLATGTLVLQPDSPARGSGTGSSAGSAIGFDRKRETDERWWYIMWLGYAYNRARMFDNPFNEVYVVGDDGNDYRLDATNLKEIISRKFTQFAQISEETGIRYVQEMVKKYHPGTRIKKVDSSKGILMHTDVLTGRMVLVVPVQRYPIPRAVLEEAKRLNVTIRDDFGNEFRFDQPQQTYQRPDVQLELAPGARLLPDARFGTPPGGSPDAGIAPGYIDLTE